ncbi:MAG: hypothetical protein LBU34_14570, partial [Planctomycetaceae bacterium]|nr:hypothetical protein [Planctomycetaceae bacterium]
MSETGYSPFSVLRPSLSVTFDIDTIVRQIMVDLTEKPETIRSAVKTDIKTDIQYEVKNNIEKPFKNE